MHSELSPEPWVPPRERRRLLNRDQRNRFTFTQEALDSLELRGEGQPGLGNSQAGDPPCSQAVRTKRSLSLLQSGKAELPAQGQKEAS
jgi:hypothetical protein